MSFEIFQYKINQKINHIIYHYIYWTSFSTRPNLPQGHSSHCLHEGLSPVTPGAQRSSDTACGGELSTLNAKGTFWKSKTKWYKKAKHRKRKKCKPVELRKSFYPKLQYILWRVRVLWTSTAPQLQLKLLPTDLRFQRHVVKGTHLVIMKLVQGTSFGPVGQIRTNWTSYDWSWNSRHSCHPHPQRPQSKCQTLTLGL